MRRESCLTGGWNQRKEGRSRGLEVALKPLAFILPVQNLDVAKGNSAGGEEDASKTQAELASEKLEAKQCRYSRGY